MPSNGNRFDSAKRAKFLGLSLIRSEKPDREELAQRRARIAERSAQLVGADLCEMEAMLDRIDQRERERLEG